MVDDPPRRGPCLVLTLSRIWICLHNVSPCRSSQHFQRDIVRGVEGYIVTGSKQVEIGRQLNSRVSFIEHMNLNFGTVNVMCFVLIGNKLCEDGKKYGTENTCTSGSTLSKAALSFAKARSMMEKERGNLLKALGTQVLPIVAFISIMYECTGLWNMSHICFPRYAWK